VLHIDISIIVTDHVSKDSIIPAVLPAAIVRVHNVTINSPFPSQPSLWTRTQINPDKTGVDKEFINCNLLILVCAANASIAIACSISISSRYPSAVSSTIC